MPIINNTENTRFDKDIEQLEVLDITGRNIKLNNNFGNQFGNFLTYNSVITLLSI